MRRTGSQRASVSAKCIALHVFHVYRSVRFRTAFKVTVKYIQVLNSLKVNFPLLFSQMRSRFSWLGSLGTAASVSVDFDLLSIGFDCFSGPRYYPKLVRRVILSALRCNTPEDNGVNHGDYGAYLDPDPLVVCTTTAGDPTSAVTYDEHIWPYAIVTLVLFSLGIPLFIFLLLSRKRWPVNLLHDVDAVDGEPKPSLAGSRLKSFYNMFSPAWWFFGPVDLLRQFFLCGFVGSIFVGGRGGASIFGDNDVSARLAVAVLVCIFFMTLFLSQEVYLRNTGGRTLATTS
eukprot:g688.t1